MPRKHRTKNRRKKKIAIILLLILTLSGVAGAGVYYKLRQDHLAVLARMVVDCGTPLPAETLDDRPSKVSDTAAHTIYSNAMLAAENIAALEADGLYEYQVTHTGNTKALEQAISGAIHIIAVGNGVTDDEVRRIVRYGWAKRW